MPTYVLSILSHMTDFPPARPLVSHPPAGGAIIPVHQAVLLVVAGARLHFVGAHHKTCLLKIYMHTSDWPAQLHGSRNQPPLLSVVNLTT